VATSSPDNSKLFGAGKGRWFTIRLHDGARHQFRGVELARARSPRADIIVAYLDCLGRTLFHNRRERLDEGLEELEISELMHSEKEGYAYNELVTHPPLLAVHSPRRVLVLGGGSLYTAREVIQHPSVDRVDVVDYDPEITEFVIRNYDARQGQTLADPRVRVLCDDVRAVLSQTPERFYDVVIDDLIDIVRPEDRWVLGLYPAIARSLKPGGFFGTYLYPSWFHSELNRLIVAALRGSGLESIWTTEESVFTYSWPEGFTSYILASRNRPEYPGDINSEIAGNFYARKLSTLQFNPEIHRVYPISHHPSFGQMMETDSTEPSPKAREKAVVTLGP
jgi:spermidine synthase